MSNIRTMSDILSEHQENTRPLPSSWASGGHTQFAENDRESLIGFQPTIQAQFIDMNGMPQTVSSGSKLRTCCLMTCPCFVDPCGQQRRSEYLQSLMSFTVPLTILQIIMFIVEMIVGKGFAPASLNPMLGPTAQSLVTLGAKQGYLVQHGQVWRLVIPILLHAGIIHLLMNLLCQWRFGLFLERRWKTWKFALLYIVSGIGSLLASCVLYPNKIGVGASGALMGMLGGFVADLILAWNKTPPFSRNIMIGQTLFWIALALLLGISPLVDTAAHIGGLLVGFLMGFILLNEIETKFRRILVYAVPSFLLFVYFVVGGICFWTVIKPDTFPPQ